MKKPVVHTYLFLGGQCAEALKFYQKTLGAKVTFQMTYGESPEAAPPGRLARGWEKKIMHCTFEIGQTMLMASDGCGPDYQGEGFSLSLSLPTAAAAKKAFKALSSRGKVEMPLSKTFWSPCFGMLTDRFGVKWMVSVAA
jgi:PhnB protein